MPGEITGTTCAKWQVINGDLFTEHGCSQAHLYEDHGRVECIRILSYCRPFERLKPLERFDMWSRKPQFSGTAGLDGRKLATSVLLLPGACFT
jgi:hypothetical protein